MTSREARAVLLSRYMGAFDARQQRGDGK